MSPNTVLAIAALAFAGLPPASSAAETDWPAYNRTLTSERFAALDAINTKNVKALRVLCSYDTGEQSGFQTGLVQVEGALSVTTEHDTLSIDPNTCAQNWRAHEDFASGALRVNRGLAWLEGQGGAEWNSPAYDPALNLIFTGEVDWCVTVHASSADAIAKAPMGQPWSGSPDGFGKTDDPKDWAGWMTATDADIGRRVWQFTAPFPLMGDITPTAGGVLFFGDMGGNFYAFDAGTGGKLWSTDLGGAIAGGVISYDTGAGQRVAVAAGMTSPIWPTPKINGKVVVLGL
ncbi:MAG TPA: PQQ-binding-like beta-propeller repeat protein [Steroidobacteraceae bacterium]|nr:PQQ-binding-like beta-propeller repeat protein [Steroidobacteraceae bacterium]